MVRLERKSRRPLLDTLTKSKISPTHRAERTEHSDWFGARTFHPQLMFPPQTINNF